MTKLTYTEQLASPHWQRKRLEILNERGFQCEECFSEDKQLHVHHRQYIRGRMAWEYDNDMLGVLCKDCHAAEHEVDAAITDLVAQAKGFIGTKNLHALLLGLSAAPLPDYVDGATASLFSCADEKWYWAGFVASYGDVSSADGFKNLARLLGSANGADINGVVLKAMGASDAG